MKVEEIMTTSPKTCDLNASLADVAKTMWDHDCGVLPVLKDGKEIVGVITDRDVCMGIAMRDQNPSAISVEEVMPGTLYLVKADDDVSQALEMMQEHKVRRLPVIDEGGELKGMLSINDLTLRAEDPAGETMPDLAYRDVMKTYKAICAHPVPMKTGQSLVAGAQGNQ